MTLVKFLHSTIEKISDGQVWWIPRFTLDRWFFCKEKQWGPFISTERSFWNTFFNATGHLISNTTETFTFSKNINALKRNCPPLEKKQNGLQSNILPFNLLKKWKKHFWKVVFVLFACADRDDEAGLIELEKIIWNASSLNLSYNVVVKK
jgi:hypothetical protein